MSIIQVQDPAGRGLPRINLRIALGHQSSDEAIFDVFTDLNGGTGWPIPYWPAGDYTLWVNDRNVDPAYQALSVFKTNTADETIVLQPTGVAPIPPTPQPPTAVEKLTGIDRSLHRFTTASGAKVKLKGADAFLLFKRFLDGENIDPQLDQLHELGFNVLRVMGMFESLGGFNPKAYPNYYPQICVFLERCRVKGFWVLWTCCAATGAWMTDDEAIAHIKATVAEGKQAVNFLCSPVNEQGQHNNDIPIHRLSEVDWADVLHDNGSYGMDEPCPPPLGHWAPLHIRRVWSAVIKDNCVVDHPNFPQVEVALDEPDRYGDEGNQNVNQCRDAAGTAQTAIFWVFHSMQGERAEVLHGNTLDCATAAIGAMKGQ